MVRPDGAALVLVGDLTPARLIEAARTALDGWTGRPPRSRIPALPAPPAGPLAIVDRSGSVQSSFRLGGPALPRTDPGYPALQLANLIFGGYFTSRWTENLREDKGYTYGPHSRIDHHVLGSSLGLSVEVATKDTAPAHLETLYELGRIATLPVSEQEVASVKQYAIGSLALSTATQAGLASTLSALSAFGLGLDWITGHPERLLATSVEQVSAAAARFFAPARLTSVVVGDADQIADRLAGLGPVER
jgi:predicted Zn-dependent peptidase